MRSKYNHTPIPSEYSTDPNTGSVRVPLQSRKYPGLFALIDPEDEVLIRGYPWYAHLNGNVYYAITNIGRANGRSLSQGMHRIILGVDDPKVHVDHVNHDGLDNRRSNIRICTPAENAANARGHIGSTSVYRGVNWHRQNRLWHARLQPRGEELHLGLFDREEDAAIAHDIAAIECYGEFACLNFPDMDITRDVVARIERVRRKPQERIYRGVYIPQGRKRWRAEVIVKGKCRVIGTWDTAEEAARAYDVAARDLHGDKALLNFPGDPPSSEAVRLWDEIKSGNRWASQYRGVSRDERGNWWIARFRGAGQNISLGYFKSEVEAARAYDKAAHEALGDKATLNFPDEVQP